MCKSLYVCKPCSKEKVEIKDKLVAGFNKTYIKIMFKTLRKNCPCIECLVKVVCLKDRFNCDSYVALLALVRGSRKGFSK
jgi:hypothetical protein